MGRGVAQLRRIALRQSRKRSAVLERTQGEAPVLPTRASGGGARSSKMPRPGTASGSE